MKEILPSNHIWSKEHLRSQCSVALSRCQSVLTSLSRQSWQTTSNGFTEWRNVSDFRWPSSRSQGQRISERHELFKCGGERVEKRWRKKGGMEGKVFVDGRIMSRMVACYLWKTGTPLLWIKPGGCRTGAEMCACVCVCVLSLGWMTGSSHYRNSWMCLISPGKGLWGKSCPLLRPHPLCSETMTEAFVTEGESSCGYQVEYRMSHLAGNWKKHFLILGSDTYCNSLNFYFDTPLFC